MSPIEGYPRGAWNTGPFERVAKEYLERMEYQSQLNEQWRSVKVRPMEVPLNYYEDCYMQAPCVAPSPVAKHMCKATCKEEEMDFYEGIITYHRLSTPELVEKEEKVCKNPRCLLERIKINIK